MSTIKNPFPKGICDSKTPFFASAEKKMRKKNSQWVVVVGVLNTVISPYIL